MFYVSKSCGRCGHLADFEFKRVTDFTLRSVELVNEMARVENNTGRSIDFGGPIPDKKDIVRGVSLCFCPHCKQPTLIIYECMRNIHEAIVKVVPGDKGMLDSRSALINVIEMLPKPKAADKDPNWPTEIIEIFADAQNMLTQNMTPSIILATCRTVLDVATKIMLPDTTATLYKRIELLREQGVITEPIKEWAHAIRLDGNDAAHDATGKRESAGVYIEFLKMFLNVAFALPARIERRKNPPIEDLLL